MSQDRFDRGMKTLGAINSQAGERILKRLKSISPDMARLVIEFPYGDIYSRPGLDIQTREIVTLSSLATQGGCDLELKAHIHNALNAGCAPEEIVEVFMQIAVYAGFPRSLHALDCAREVFQSKGIIVEEETD